MVHGRTPALFANACRICLVALTALTALACAPALAVHGSAAQAPTIDDGDFVARDGVRLPLRHWDASSPKAVIVALHGMSDYSEAFDMPGPWWAFNGIEVYAYDQRGFGGAPNPGLWSGGGAMREDLADFVDAVHVRYPGVPVYALGESMGGAVVLSALAGPHPPRIAGAILVAPAVWSRSDMPLSYSAALWLAAHTVPWWHLSGEGLKIWPSDNVPMLRKLSRDPLYQHEARADQVYGLVNLMDEARHAPTHLQGTTPILFLHGVKDQVIPPASADAVAKELGSRADTRVYPDGYHMLLRDLYGERVWKDIADWIDKTNQSPAATSGR